MPNVVIDYDSTKRGQPRCCSTGAALDSWPCRNS